VAIAAYSSCVPTLAISYSAKSQGIASDLGMSKYVVSTNDCELRDKFVELVREEQQIKSQLADEMAKPIRKHSLDLASCLTPK